MGVGDRLRQSMSGFVWRARPVLAHVLTSTRLKANLQRAGVYDALRSVDDLLVDRTPYLKPPNPEVSVGDVTCTFYVGSIREYERFWKQDSPNRYPESEDDMPVLADLLERVESHDTFWDVGANVGIYASFVGRLLQSGTVVAVEPRPENAARIKRNLARNGAGGRVVRCALSNRTGTMAFEAPESEAVGASGALLDDGEAETTAEVVRGDELAERASVPSPNVLKIDVVGAEYDVLRGLDGELTNEDCRLVYCNVCSEMSDVPDGAVHDLLGDHGFDVERIWDWPNGEGHYVRAEKPRPNGRNPDTAGSQDVRRERDADRDQS